MSKHRVAFEAVETMVSNWKIGDFVYHIRFTKDHDDEGVEFNVIFSKPTPTCPVPPHTANVQVFVVKSMVNNKLVLTYGLETEQQRHPSHEILYHDALAAVIRHKERMTAMTRSFARNGVLPDPKRFVPGQYLANANIAAKTASSEQEKEVHVEDALEEAAVVGAKDAQIESETDEQLSALLESIFRKADANGDGTLDLDEFRKAVSSDELKLNPDEIDSLMLQADANRNGKIEYAEFVPLGCEMIAALRARESQLAHAGVEGELAEAVAHETMHGYSKEKLNEVMLQAFQEYDADHNGKLSIEEFETCLRATRLNQTSLTKSEITAAMRMADVNKNGVVEYIEFVPLMYDTLVKAMASAFLHERKLDQTERYLLEVFRLNDLARKGVFSLAVLKNALKEADLLKLSDLQVHAIASIAPFDADGNVDYNEFVRSAAAMVQRIKNPKLTSKHTLAVRRAALMPLAALNEEKKESVKGVIKKAFAQQGAEASGNLDASDFFRCLKEAALGLTRAQVNYLYSSANVDTDGKVSIDEFANVAFQILLNFSLETALSGILDEAAGASLAPGVAQAQAAKTLLESCFLLRAVYETATAGGSATKTTNEFMGLLRSEGPAWGFSSAGLDIMMKALGSLEGGAPLYWRELYGAVTTAAEACLRDEDKEALERLPSTITAMGKHARAP